MAKTPYQDYLKAYVINGSGASINEDEFTDDIGDDNLLAIAIAVEDLRAGRGVRTQQQLRTSLNELTGAKNESPAPTEPKPEAPITRYGGPF